MVGYADGGVDSRAEKVVRNDVLCVYLERCKCGCTHPSGQSKLS